MLGALAVRRSRRGGDVVSKAGQLLAECKYPQASPLSRPEPQGVKRRPQGFADRRCERRQCPGELGDRVAEAIAEACPWKQRPHALAGTVEAIDEDPFDPGSRLLLECCTLKRPRGLGKGRRTGALSVAQRPDHTTTDNCGQIHLVGETVTMLLIG
jgi:hypothetical protein